MFSGARTLTMSGSTGESGPATAAKLKSPNGVAATADGGYLIADTSNQAIRRVSPAGTITTVAGTLTVPGSTRDGGPPPPGQPPGPPRGASTPPRGPPHPRTRHRPHPRGSPPPGG